MKKDIKNKIMEATIALIEKNGSNPDSITIQDICGRVKIGSGLVNYHFQTKENLIAQCVQKIIEDVIRKHGTVYQSLNDLTPEQKLRFMVKSTFTYLMTHENISKISIMTDFKGDNPKDNTSQTFAAYYPLIRNACPETISDREVTEKTYLMILMLQAVFLRANLLKQEIGVDFHDEQQRARLIDRTIDICVFN